MSGVSDQAMVGVKPVEERHRLDEAKLEAWMRAHVADYEGPLELFQFKGGQSNPTYRIDTPTRKYVLRRKPFGKLLPSAHAVDREFRVISALHAQGFPVAKPYGLEVDDTVLGAMFYVMGCVEGRHFWAAHLPDVPVRDRAAIFNAQTETLAKLHAFEPSAIGLGDYGKPGNYIARQIDRWSKQYVASETEKIDAMDRLMAWLPTTVPPQERVSIVHGDYRLDNMLYHASEPRVAAVIDWELSTLGDPLADFTYFLMVYQMPPAGAMAGSNGVNGLSTIEHGIPALEDTVALYCRLTGRPPLANLDWYYAYNFFRLAAILQGIAGRIRDGTASSANAIATAARAQPLAESAWTFAQRAGA
jgi:aminoglycoside phosphotransferase (APT) family kinase protein